MTIAAAAIIVASLLIALAALTAHSFGQRLLRQQARFAKRLLALDEELFDLEEAIEKGPEQIPIPLQTPQGLPAGTPAPSFQLPDLHGKRVSLASFLGKKVLLVAWSPTCGFCQSMAPEVAKLPHDGRGGRPIPVLITSGSAEENRELVEQHRIAAPVLLQQDHEIQEAYRAMPTPTGYLIDERGVIVSDYAMGAVQLLELARDPEKAIKKAKKPNKPAEPSEAGAAVGRGRVQRDGLAAGTTAPLFRLPRVDGGELALEDLRGERVLLVFSDPHCEPCQRLARELEPLHRRLPSPRIVMVSRRDMEANRAKVEEHGLTFPVVLQRHWEVSRDYAIFATPVAYLIDEQGVLASDPAVGVDAVLSLAETAANRIGKEVLPVSG
jgi:peroxiredoxin